MPKGPTRPWKQRREPVTDHFIQASVKRGMNPTTGFYGELIVNDLSGLEEAREMKTSLFRCARYLGFSMNAQIERTATGDYQVRFKAIDKAVGRAYIARKHPDPSTMPYNPYAKNPPKDAA